jgi:hypothetical protein
VLQTTLVSESDDLNANMKQTDVMETGSVCQGNGAGGATVFEQVSTVQRGLCQSAGLSADNSPEARTDELPNWCSKIVEQLVKTILKPIIKLRPSGSVNWRNYGKMIGLFERYKTFITHDIERMFTEQGFDKITDQQWEKITPLFGLDKLRERLAVLLGRPVADDEPLENAVNELLERQFQHLDNLKCDAFRHLAQQDAKATSLFFKGMAEGYNCFLGTDGRYVGDRGRTRLYLEFLAHRMEIEKFRRTMPGASRRDLQKWVIHETKIPITNDDEWFDHFCDEICLGVKGVGRKRNAPIL